MIGLEEVIIVLTLELRCNTCVILSHVVSVIPSLTSVIKFFLALEIEV